MYMHFVYRSSAAIGTTVLETEISRPEQIEKFTKYIEKYSKQYLL